MAYLALSDGPAGALLPTPFLVSTPEIINSDIDDGDVGNDNDLPEPARFSALEWSVVALAQKDNLLSLREPGPLSIAIGRLFGAKPNPKLADGRLESLRRVAVLAWRHGYVIPKSEIAAFFTAGFSADHYDLLQASIGKARAKIGLRSHS